jgi:heme/copper-type cytochrome/quinol oxidase subunit 3
VIETTEFLCLITSYFYLRSSTSDWPPGDMHLPGLLMPTIATALMVLSAIPTYLGDHAIKKNDRRGLIVNLIITALLELAFVALLIDHLLTLNYDWTKNAYTSAFFILITTHLVFAGIMILENLYILIQAQRGLYNAERHWAVEVDGMSSYLVIAAWVAIYATVFLSPYVI